MQAGGDNPSPLMVMSNVAQTTPLASHHPRYETPCRHPPLFISTPPQHPLEPYLLPDTQLHRHPLPYTPHNTDPCLPPAPNVLRMCSPLERLLPPTRLSTPPSNKCSIPDPSLRTPTLLPSPSSIRKVSPALLWRGFCRHPLRCGLLPAPRPSSSLCYAIASVNRPQHA